MINLCVLCRGTNKIPCPGCKHSSKKVRLTCARCEGTGLVRCPACKKL